MIFIKYPKESSRILMKPENPCPKSQISQRKPLTKWSKDHPTSDSTNLSFAFKWLILDQSINNIKFGQNGVHGVLGIKRVIYNLTPNFNIQPPLQLKQNLLSIQLSWECIDSKNSFTFFVHIHHILILYNLRPPQPIPLKLDRKFPQLLQHPPIKKLCTWFRVQQKRYRLFS